MQRNDILREIKRLADENAGTAPGALAFERQTGIRVHEWRGRYWEKWSDALIDAGFAPNVRQPAYERDFLLEKLAQATRYFSGFPTTIQMKMYKQTDEEFPARQTLNKILGSKTEMQAALRDWIGNVQRYEDVLHSLPDSAPEPTKTERNGRTDGSVYLLKSGSHYKIGRSDEIERRLKEVRVAMPESVTLVHSIRTDDPAGIEAYWHRRFAEKRANGEWFRLVPEDIRAFKRRTFQ